MLLHMEHTNRMRGTRGSEVVEEEVVEVEEEEVVEVEAGIRNALSQSPC
jgi:hypothetical protein